MRAAAGSADGNWTCERAERALDCGREAVKGASESEVKWDSAREDEEGE